MSILGRIRQNIALIAIIIFVALLAFVLTDFIRGITTLVAGPLDAGYIAGEPISQQEYNNILNNQQQNATDELSRGRASDQAFNNLVLQKILEKEYEKSGIDVSAEELSDLLYGRNISPQLLQAPAFRDSTGNFSPGAVQAYFQQLLT